MYITNDEILDRVEMYESQSEDTQFFKNWGLLFLHFVDGTADPIDSAMMSTGRMVRVFNGWDFWSPSASEVRDFMESGKAPKLVPFQKWDPDGDGEIVSWTVDDFKQDKLPDVIREFIGDILSYDYE